jgi:hypothetical protein
MGWHIYQRKQGKGDIIVLYSCVTAPTSHIVLARLQTSSPIIRVFTGLLFTGIVENQHCFPIWAFISKNTISFSVGDARANTVRTRVAHPYELDQIFNCYTKAVAQSSSDDSVYSSFQTEQHTPSGCMLLYLSEPFSSHGFPKFLESRKTLIILCYIHETERTIFQQS